MGNFNAIDVLQAEGLEQKIASQKSEENLREAIYDVKRQYGEFLNNASDMRGFKDRVAMVKDDMMKTVDTHLMPVTGVMNKVVQALRDDFKKKKIAVRPMDSAGNPIEEGDFDRFNDPGPGFLERFGPGSQSSHGFDPHKYTDNLHDFSPLDIDTSEEEDLKEFNKNEPVHLRGPWNNDGRHSDEVRSMGGRDYPHLSKKTAQSVPSKVVWQEAPGEDPQHRIAWPEEDVELSVEPNGDELWSWEVKDGATVKGSGDALTPDQAQQDAETCYKIEIVKIHEASRPRDRAHDTWASGRDRGDAEHKKQDLEDSFDPYFNEPPIGIPISNGPYDPSQDPDWEQYKHLYSSINDAPELVNEGDWEGYLDEVDDNAEGKIEHNFADQTLNTNFSSETHEPNFVKGTRTADQGWRVDNQSFDMNQTPNTIGTGLTPADQGADMYTTFQEQQSPGLIQAKRVAIELYSDWCESNELPKVSKKSLQLYSRNVNQREYNTIQAAIKEAEGKHRKEWDWGRSSPSEEFPYEFAEGPGGLYTVGDSDVGVIVEHHSDPQDLENGEVGTIYGQPGWGAFAPEGYPEGFSSRDEAKDWAERRDVPQGGGRHRASKLEKFFTGALTDSWDQQYDRAKKDWYDRSHDVNGEYVHPKDRDNADSHLWGKSAVRRQSIQDERALLEKADAALTDLLNNRAETFQETLAPIQQALQAVQYAEAVEQAANPMNVMPPAGTVDVMPQTKDPGAPPNLNMPPVGPPPPGTVDPMAGVGGGDPLLEGLQAAGGGQ